MKQLFATIILTVCSIGLSSAQMMRCGVEVPDSTRAFDDGEKLSYGVTYSAAFINVVVADIDFHTTRERFSNQDCFKIYAVGRTRTFFNFFFEMEDKYYSWVNAKTLRPLRATSNIREGAYRYRSAIDFEWAKMEVFTEGENIKSGRNERHKFDLSSCSYDALSLFFNMRCVDFSKLYQGENQSLTVVFDDTIRNVRLRYLGKEVRKIKKIGEVRTRKFACQLATSNDESFKDGDEFFIWLTDDKNAIPVYLESPIRVGKVFATLSSWSDLAHPFSSVVVKQ